MTVTWRSKLRICLTFAHGYFFASLSLSPIAPYSQRILLDHIHIHDYWHLFSVDICFAIGALVNDSNLDSGHACDILEGRVG